MQIRDRMYFDKKINIYFNGQINFESLSLNDYKIEHKSDWITQMNF